MNAADSFSYGYFLPPDISTHGYLIDRLIHWMHYFMFFLAAVWGIYFLYCLMRFRAREGHRAVYEPIKAKGSKYLEIFVVVFEAILLVGFAIPAWGQIKQDTPEEDKALVVRVVAQQFRWNIHYAGLDRKFGRTNPRYVSADSLNRIGIDANDPAAQDDIWLENQLHVPVNQPVVVKLSSLDVIHGFGVNVLRLRQDAVPGQVATIWFQATREGGRLIEGKEIDPLTKKPRRYAEYPIACSQLCGNSHYSMDGMLIVESEAEFKAFLDEQAGYMKDYISTWKDEQDRMPKPEPEPPGGGSQGGHHEGH